jgi:hypothetical protein
MAFLLCDVADLFASAAVVGSLEDVGALVAELEVDYVGGSRRGQDLLIQADDF